MRLDSVRELKARLLPRVAAGPPIQRSIALGITQRNRAYRLAVRVQRTSLVSGPLLEEIVARARGECDVRYIGHGATRGRTPWYQCRVRPLLIGTSVSHVDASAGSIGGFCVRRGALFVLSNNHVLANEDFGKTGDEIVQPSPSRGGRRGADCVARLGPWVRLATRTANAVDAALARVEENVPCDPQRLRGMVAGKDRSLAGVRQEPLGVGETVYKLGQSTGATAGRVTVFELDNLVIGYTLRRIRFDDQIEIESVGPQPFSAAGDSGALIVDSRMRAAGLLFASSDSHDARPPRGSRGRANDRGDRTVTFANPIASVLTSLKAAMIV